LGVDSSFVPSVLLEKINASENVSIRSSLLSKLINKRKLIKKHKFGAFLIGFLKKFRVNKLAALILDWNFNKRAEFQKAVVGAEVLDDASKNVLQKIYHDDIKNLEKLINRDLSFWL
jgi:hypothetical protein